MSDKDDQPTGAWLDDQGLRWYSVGDPSADYISVTSMRKLLGTPIALSSWISSRIIDTAIESPTLLSEARVIEAKEMERRIKRRDGREETEKEARIRARRAARKVIREKADEERDTAATRGTNVHLAIAEGHDISTLPEEQRPYVEQYARAVIALDIRPILFERTVISRKGYAGSFDLLADVTLESGEDTRLLIDFKTSKGMYTDHLLQGEAYLRADSVVGPKDGILVVDDEATRQFKTAKAAALLHLTTTGWALHVIADDPDLTRAHSALAFLANFLAKNPTPIDLFRGGT